MSQRRAHPPLEATYAGPPVVSTDALALARRVTAEARRVGRRSLSADLIERLAAVRDWHVVLDPYLDAFLSCALDQHDGRFWNRTYLFLPVLEVVMAEHGLEPSYVAELLVADIVRHELAAADGDDDATPLGRPDPRTLRTRVRHALRFAGLDGTLSPDPPPDLPSAPSATARAWLALTAQPVSTVHDEYFFIRVLQAHEMSFTAMSRHLGEAVVAVRAGELDAAAATLERVVALMDRNASLFRIVATMRREAFHTFRELTDGASAIQSEQYKRFEARCGTPPPSRLRCPAFGSVPGVRDEVLAGQDTMTDAYADAAARGGDRAGLATIAAHLRDLEESHRRWKATHVTLASRVLGSARGSGHTSGVDYLRTWVDHRLFWRLPELAAAESPRRSA